MENTYGEEIYIASGLHEDCEKLVLSDRITDAEMMGFCEEAFDIAKNFTLPACRLSQRIAGIFLLYAFFSKAPIKGPKIRITMAGWQNLMKLREDLFHNKQFQAVFVLNQLIERHAFHFCVREQESGLENYYILKDCMKGYPRRKLSHCRDDQLAKIFGEIADLSKSYVQTKNEIAETTGEALPWLHNGREIERLLPAGEEKQGSEVGRKLQRNCSNGKNLMVDSPSESDDDDENFHFNDLL